MPVEQHLNHQIDFGLEFKLSLLCPDMMSEHPVFTIRQQSIPQDLDDQLSSKMVN